MFDASSVNRNQPKPSSTISMPTRFAGRAAHAYRPVPTKLQITAGAKTAHTIAGVAVVARQLEHDHRHGRDERRAGDRRGAGDGQRMLFGVHAPEWSQAAEPVWVSLQLKPITVLEVRVADRVAGRCDGGRGGDEQSGHDGERRERAVAGDAEHGGPFRGSG